MTTRKMRTGNWIDRLRYIKYANAFSSKINFETCISPHKNTSANDSYICRHTQWKLTHRYMIDANIIFHLMSLVFWFFFCPFAHFSFSHFVLDFFCFFIFSSWIHRWWHFFCWFVFFFFHFFTFISIFHGLYHIRRFYLARDYVRTTKIIQRIHLLSIE